MDLKVMINGVEYDAKYEPLWWHLKGLSQTATGFGSKLTTARKVFFQGRWRRIYVVCYSNSGTAYIIVKGKVVIVH